MTKAEAIELLVNATYSEEWQGNEQLTKAQHMAIETLQHEQERREDIYECPNCIGEVHKNYIYCPFCGIKVGE